MVGSKINPMLTLEYMQTEHENKYFDRKSAAIRPSDLAPHISGFANADGGTLVIGISDKKLIMRCYVSLELPAAPGNSSFYLSAVLFRLTPPVRICSTTRDQNPLKKLMAL